MVAPCAKKAKNTLPQYGVIISFLALLFNRFLALFPFSSVFYNLVKFSHFVRILLSHRTCAKLGGLGQCQQSFGIPGFKGGDTTLQKCGKLRRIGWCIRRQAAAHQKAVDAAKHGQHPRVAAAPAIPHGMAAGQHQQHRSSQQAPPQQRRQNQPAAGHDGGCGFVCAALPCCGGGVLTLSFGQRVGAQVGLLGTDQHAGGHLHGGPALAGNVHLRPGVGVIVLQNGVPAAVLLLGKQALRRGIAHHIARRQPEHAEHNHRRRGKLHTVPLFGFR